MNSAKKTTMFDLRRAATWAALATFTTLGMFSLLANVTPPLVADGPVLVSSHERMCAPTAQVLEADQCIFIGTVFSEAAMIRLAKSA